MNNWTKEFIWNFPGGIEGLIAVSAVALIAIFVSYYFTLRKLSLKPKVALSIIRIFMVALFIFCLSNPRIIEKEKTAPIKKQKIAVLIDSSASMLKKGFWNKIRFEEAKKYFEEKINIANTKYDFNLYSFNKKIKKVNNFNAPISKDIDSQTHLFNALEFATNSFVNDGIKGVITLTDGIDTSGETSNKILSSLESSPLKFAYVPITTSIYSPPLVNFEKIESESIARVGTESPITVLFRTTSFSKNQEFNLIVKEGDNIINTREFKAKDENSSLNVINFNIPIKKEGNQIYTAEIESNEEKLSSTSWSIKGVQNKKVSVLLYQGRLDWGTRYIKGVFDKDENISIDIRFAPNSFGKGFKEDTMNVKFPRVKDFNKYDVVIMLNLKQEQISKDLEKKLSDYLNKGGSILFVVANSEIAKEFSSSPIEKLLPVNFSFKSNDKKMDYKTKIFLEKMKNYRTTQSLSYLRNVRSKKLSLPPLSSFKLTKYGMESPMFNFAGNDTQAAKMIIPQFIDCAIIDKAKPGATVLAVHPQLNRILFATQKYGKGRSAILATDLLWQWRLTLSSKDFSYDNFWQSLIGWLGVRQGNQPSWVLASSIYNPKRKDEIKFYLPKNYKYSFNEIKFNAIQNNLEEQVVLSSSKEENIYITDFSPKKGKNYILQAIIDNETIASTCINGPPDTVAKELKILKADLETLKDLTISSNGIVVDTKKEFDWEKWLPDSVKSVSRIKENNLWHKNWIFILILSLYIMELIIRRKIKLV